MAIMKTRTTGAAFLVAFVVAVGLMVPASCAFLSGTTTTTTSTARRLFFDRRNKDNNGNEHRQQQYVGNSARNNRKSGGRVVATTLFSQAAPSYGLYEVQEEILTKRGFYEQELMTTMATKRGKPIKENKPKGAGAAGGFGGVAVGGGGKKKNRSGNKPSSSVTSTSYDDQAKDHAKVLERDGVVRMDRVLSPETADELLKFVTELRQKATDVTTTATETGDTKLQKLLNREKYFADVLLRNNRCDLTMPLRFDHEDKQTPTSSQTAAATTENDAMYIDLKNTSSDPVIRGLSDALLRSPVGKTVEKALGSDAVLHELSCLISDPGSDRQVMHPDTPYIEGKGPVLFTCFMALQDIRPDMGPTCWLPGTHTKYHHDLFQDETVPSSSTSTTTTAGDASDDETRRLSPKDELLRTHPQVLGTLPKGACAVYDSRILHCGTANVSHLGKIKDKKNKYKNKKNNKKGKSNDAGADDEKEIKGGSGTTRAVFYFSFKSPSIGYTGNPPSIRPELENKFRLQDITKRLSQRTGNAYG